MADVRQLDPMFADEWLPYRSLVRYAIGGGWGDESPKAGTVPVRVIRGTDFKNILNGDLPSVPLRYETSRRASSRQLKDGDVILEISGGSRTSNQFTGRSFFVSQNLLDCLGETVIPASFCRLVRFDEGLIAPRYAYYALQNMHLTGRAALYEQQSTGISNFQFEYFLDEETLRVPPLPEQRAITGILSALDDKIELNRRMNETLEQMARALFQSWFVDFDPVRAKTEGREPYLPPDLWALFPDRLVDSELGEIPVGWSVKTLGNCYNLTMGQSPPGSSYNRQGDGLPFFQGKTEFGTRYPRSRRYCNAPARMAKPDDTLVSVRAPVGAINMAWDQCCLGRGVAALRHKSGARSFTYYSVWTLQPELQEFEQTGTVFGAINKREFENLAVVEPPVSLVDAFENSVREWDERIRVNVAEAFALATQRDALLPKLVSGEIAVDER